MSERKSECTKGSRPLRRGEKSSFKLNYNWRQTVNKFKIQEVARARDSLNCRPIFSPRLLVACCCSVWPRKPTTAFGSNCCCFCCRRRRLIWHEIHLTSLPLHATVHSPLASLVSLRFRQLNAQLSLAFHCSHCGCYIDGGGGCERKRRMLWPST